LVSVVNISWLVVFAASFRYVCCLAAVTMTLSPQLQ
jgi:hypothetical protein